MMITSGTTVQELEELLAKRGFTLKKTYDTDSGLCKVVADNPTTNTSIVSKNTSRAGLWSAYRTALSFTLQQLIDYDKKVDAGVR